MTMTKAFSRILRRLRREAGGNLIIEFALIAPLMLSMLFGVIEFRRLAYTQSAINFAAEETTRFAIVRGGDVTNTEILTFAESKLLGLNEGLAVLCLLTPVDATTQTSTVSITIDYNFDLLLPIPIDPITLQGSSEGYISFSPVDPDTDLSGECDTPT